MVSRVKPTPPHHVFSIVAPVTTQSLDDVRKALPPPGHRGLPLKVTRANLPTLHFASIVVFDGEPFEGGPTTMPYVVMQCCIDGPIEEFIDRLVTLDDAQDGPLRHVFEPCIGFLKAASFTAFLLKHRHYPDLCHIGVPGMRRFHIRSGQLLRHALDKKLDAIVSSGGAQDSPEEIVDQLRTELNVPAPAGDQLYYTTRGWVADPISLWSSRLFHWGKLLGFGLLVIGPLLGIGWLLGGVAGMIAAILSAGIAFWIFIRWLHGNDSRPIVLDANRLASLKEIEDRGTLNHMCTFTLLRPGRLRRGAAHLVLHTLELFYRTLYTDITPGRLSGLPTIHFAHWTLVPIVDRDNKAIGDALMFLSNYDGTWEAYLDDFIEMLADGVAAIWSSCVGFRWPMDGPTFKAYARNGMTPWNCWYKGEPDVTVLNIQNNDAIRRGLLQEDLTPEEARLWLARFGSIKTGLERIAEPPDRLQVADVQGMVLSGYAHLPHSSHVLLRITDATLAKNWLAGLLPRITDARRKSKEDRGDTAINVAFTFQGLTKLGLPESAAHLFPIPFQEGIAPRGHDYRSRALGDVGTNSPSCWNWGGELKQVDLLLLLYADSKDALAKARLSYEQAFECTQASAHNRNVAGIIVAEINGAFIREHETKCLERGAKNRLEKLPAEHFGFVDGVSQPRINGTWQSADSGRHKEDDELKPGEFVLGYRKQDGTVAPGVPVDACDDPDRLLPRTAPGAMTGDFGRNGTFLVARQLHQHVRRFRHYVQAAAALPGMTLGADAIASRMVGRTHAGMPLAADVSPDRANDFTYADDPHGFRCPIGAHVRRANPRGSLGDDFTSSLEATQRRRLLRRGRTYGDPLKDDEEKEAPRGLMFIALNSDIERQFEFVQQNWVRGLVFSGLRHENDPIIGARRRRDTLITLQSNGVRERMTGLSEFVTVKGGDYFFLPGLRALRYLTKLPPRVSNPGPPARAIAPATRIPVPPPVRVPIITALVPRLERALGMLSLAMALRFQIVLAALLVAIGFAANGRARMIALSFFLADHWYGVTMVAAMASLAASVVMITTRLTLMYGRRIGQPRPRWQAPAQWRDVLIFQLLALPSIAACLHWNAVDRTWQIAKSSNTVPYWWELLRLTGPALLGVALGLSLVRLATWLQGLNPDARPELMFPPSTIADRLGIKRPWRRPVSTSWPRLTALGEALAARIPPSLGKGYIDYDAQRILPGHACALALAAVTLLVYAAGAILLSPWWSWSLAGRVPSLAYLLLLLIVAGWVASALAFFLDRYRLSTPLLILFVLVLVANNANTDHYFPIGGIADVGASPRAALKAASVQHPQTDKVVVVVSDGLGLVSSAWTAKVLTGLAGAKPTGRQFADSLRLLSTASGSSLGSLYFADAYTKDGLRGDLQTITNNASGPSSGEGGWGFVYPELIRTIAPVLVPKFIDRGWAMEQAWKRRLSGDEPRLSQWRRDVENGWRPATAFGVTEVETGEHKLFATYRTQSGPVIGESLEHDISLVTAARLSATFPFISPPARPDHASHGDRVEGYHLIDSGITENSGWTAAREWLTAVRPDLGSTCVLVVDILSVPTRAKEPPAADKAWMLDLVGPLEAVLNARRMEASRISEDMTAFAGTWDPNRPLTMVRFALEDDTVPLSWNLGRADTERLTKAWQRNAPGAQVVANFLTTRTHDQGCSQ
ncbi:MAG TPA: hypothetical protein VGF24_12185 [Vicinamibacterales bacterium]|jgi:Dyp-type peroxidase family